jgi:hypothetical protein
MAKKSKRSRVNLSPKRIGRVFSQWLNHTGTGQFVRDVGQIIWEFKWWSLAILTVTIFQEFAAIWPVNLLGDFIDLLDTGSVDRTVWLLFAATLGYPALQRGNIVLRRRMFHTADASKRVEIVLKASDSGRAEGIEEAGAAYTRAVNAVAGLTNTAFHVLGSFAPVIIKIVIVSSNLLSYNRTLGLVYLASLVVPAALTIVFNKRMIVLRDSQYSVIGQVSGSAIEAISDKENEEARQTFRSVIRERLRIMVSLVSRSQIFLYIRQATLIISQFAVVFIALAIRDRTGMTAGDFSKIIGYTTQVAAAFVTATAQLDAILSYSRAYHVYASKAGALTGQPDSGFRRSADT